MESPALVAILPVLSRVSNDKVEVVTRTCCVIFDKLCKIVEDPTTMIPIMSKSEPLVKAMCLRSSRGFQRATSCLTAICNHTGNKDLESFTFLVAKAAHTITNTGEIVSLHFCTDRGVTCLGCDPYNALTWSQRQGGGSHTNLLFDR